MDHTFNELIRSQTELLGRASRIVENLRKTGQANITAGAIQTRIYNLDKYWEKFELQHETLLNKFEDELKNHEYVKFAATMEEIYMSQRGNLLDHMTKYTGESNTPSHPTLARSEQSTRSSLPRIQLPTFSGNYEDWPSFRDLFQSLVMKDTFTSEVEKLHFLKGSVKGEANLLIKNLKVTTENYAQAWKTLSDAYENKRALIRSCLTKFSSIPKAKTESASELRKIFHGMIAARDSLDAIGRPIGQHDDLYVFLVTELFDCRTRRDWETSITEAAEPPTYNQLKNFLERRLQTLDAVQPARGEVKQSESSSRLENSHHSQGNEASEKPTRSSDPSSDKKRGPQSGSCVVCKKDHYTMFCPDYKGETAKERLETITQNHRCTNCLGKHKTSECPSKKVCSTCSEKHHTTLHGALAIPKPETNAHVANKLHKTCFSVLLATARVRVADRHGNLHHTRALIDQGSETSMITERLAQRLHLTRSKAAVSICGVGGVQTAIAKGRVALKTIACHNNNAVATTALILPKLTLYASNVEASQLEWSHIKGLDLADPEFDSSDSIDVLLGADVYAQVMEPGLRKGRADQPIAQKTIFGWILSGATKATLPRDTTTNHHCATSDALSSIVHRFWEQEEPPQTPTPRTTEEQRCEDIFMNGYSRTPTGRYIVRLPTTTQEINLSDTRRAAKRTLDQTLQRFTKNHELEQLYTEFMSTYEAMNHMEKTEPPKQLKAVCYLPHHGVWRASSSTTRLRVVFNGSWRTQQGSALNDFLLKGENLLPALSDVILRWRNHQFVIATDIEKMYRQILVHPDDRDYQRILWRAKSDDKTSEFRLNTVTYGLACAPFLAIRTIRQLALDEGTKFPIGAPILLQDVYVDDILTGADTTAKLIKIQQELRQLTMAGGFPLKKWISNDDTTLTGIPDEDRLVKENLSWAPTDETHPTLGLRWNQHSDNFSFSVQPTIAKTVTKRSILAQAAQLFDPLGWLTPISTRSKITIQSTWLLNSKWDDPLPHHITNDWETFYKQWNRLSEVQIPRWLSTKDSAELHGFADASEKAYAAVLYIRTKNSKEKHRVSLVTAKGRVAPLKQMSLPRLELCAAHLLAKVTHHTRKIMKWDNINTFLWTDSTVTLGWIQAPPRKWKTYVANRVSEIQSLVPDVTWSHIPGKHNPADCASRGLTPEELLTHELWWHGPEFLSTNEEPPLNKTKIELNELPEERTTAHKTTTRDEPGEHYLLNQFSSYSKLLRITAWCTRWLPHHQHSGQSISVDEKRRAEITWSRLVQGQHFKRELRALKSNNKLPKGSPLIPLTPYLDEEGLLRVGGRLKHSLLAPDAKHPIILPQKSKLSALLIDHLHQTTMHGGIQLCLGTLRQQYWIPQGRSLIKTRIHQCVRCTRWRAAPSQQLMADLPRPRVTPARPFQSTGVDYAGPIHIKTSPGRGHKTKKAFLVIFVCMATKAVHLDIASDYSTQAFIATLKRFISRRGLCAEMYSDQGTNFVGADTELRKLIKDATTQRNSFINEASLLGITWRFNPPAAPHFGGLWEAAVKSTKFHLRRVIGDATLTYEEMSTVITQIEACLNSRPLTALSDDPEDLSALTPGHFLIGAPLNAIPEPMALDTATSRLSRWQQLTQMRDHFWTRWSREYIQSLISRKKWQQASDEFKKGRLCLIRNENTPPSRWPLGRIINILPGDDGLTRVVTVKTATTTFTRPITKLVILPIASTEEG